MTAKTVESFIICYCESLRLLVSLEINFFLSRLTSSRDGPAKSTETRQGCKQRKITLLQKTTLHQLPDYATNTEYTSSLFYSTIFLEKGIFLCFHSCLVSVRFTHSSLLVFTFYGKCFTPSPIALLIKPLLVSFFDTYLWHILCLQVCGQVLFCTRIVHIIFCSSM